MGLTCAILGADLARDEVFEDYLKNSGCFLFGCYDTIEELDKVKSSKVLDVVFVNAAFLEDSSKESVESLCKKNSVVVLAADQQFAYAAIKAHVADYLLTPLDYYEFLCSISRLKDIKRQTMPASSSACMQSIWIKTSHKLVQIDLSRIQYVEGMVDYVKIVLDDDPKPLLSLTSLKKMEDLLPSALFVRIHRSFIVQPSKIKSIEKNRIVFGKQEIPISETYRTRLFSFFSTYSIQGF